MNKTKYKDGYHRSLEAAGATVIAYKTFGSYQGDWLALVEYNGQRGWVHDYYGSCSGCDAFEASFGWDKPETQESLAEFARDYLADLKSNEQIVDIASKHSAYSVEDEAMLKWVKSHL